MPNITDNPYKRTIMTLLLSVHVQILEDPTDRIA